MNKKIYIAGFDVFKEDAVEIGVKYLDLCKEYGFIGLFPLDNEFDFTQDKKKVALDIFKANKDLIDKCDVVVANLNPFRGKEADSGTIWECGYASAKNKEVIGYIDNDTSYLNTFEKDELILKDGLYWDKDNFFVEDFDHPINLMIACSIDEMVIGNFEEALKKIRTENE